MKRVNFHMAAQLTSLVSEVTDLKPGCEEGKTEILNWENDRLLHSWVYILLYQSQKRL